MSLQDDSLKGKRYSDAYNDVFQELFADTKAILNEKFAECPVQDVKGLVEIKGLRHLVDTLEGLLLRGIEDGHLANVQLEQEQEREERKQRRNRIRSVTG